LSRPSKKLSMENLSLKIASSLGISHQTVNNHVTSILRKFGVEDCMQAVGFALKRGWVKLYDEASQSQE
jgi:DNA-binding CsgD family transcriptional regulator